MADRRAFLKHAAALSMAAPAALAGHADSRQTGRAPESGRPVWVAVASRLAEPVLANLAARRLKAVMPIEARAGVTDRASFSHLEALGRLLAGIAPWLEHGAAGGEAAEQRVCARYTDLARQAVDAATDPASPDFLNFTRGSQPLVDAAFLAHAVLRAPQVLWGALPATTRRNLVAALVSTRVIRPGFNNWLLFSAMVEAALCAVGEPWDAMRVDYAVRQHEQWYKGDGVYGDGPDFHWDYYNSYVIQPMLVDVLAAVAPANKSWDAFREPVLRRARRHAAIQERLIAPDGTFPPIGRSLAYRAGAFQLLSQMALQHQLPDSVLPAQARGALEAVITKTMGAAGTFDREGWLTIGLCGHQPSVGEGYISTGSLYLCATALLPLGLPAADPFWSAPAAGWTQTRAWSGVDLPADKALSA